MSKLVIATRESPLALWQANYVADRLRALYPELTVELLGMTSRGDQLLDKPLYKVGGKGLFVKELETALLDGRADIAVHSMKDVPMALPPGLTLGVICEREDPRDALVGISALSELEQGARFGTSSLRRACQIRRVRPDLEIGFLRGQRAWCGWALNHGSARVLNLRFLYPQAGKVLWALNIAATTIG